MDRFLRHFDRTSFWLGFLAGFLALWLLGRLKPLIIQLFHRIREGIVTARLNATAGAEVRLRNEAILRAQSMHLANSLFSLDEILIPPKFILPPAQVIPGEPPAPEDIAAMTVPYMPDWPEMAALYRAPMLSLPEALMGGCSLVILGLPGSGKTVALADLACRMARRESLPENLEKLTPIYLHACDLILPEANPDAPLETLVAALKQNAALLTQARLPEYLALALPEGRTLLLLDGLDELPQVQVDEVVGFLGRLKSQYPALRTVVAASLEYYGGLARLGCVPLAISAWDTGTRREFIHRWGELWHTLFQPVEAPSQDNKEVDEELLTQTWLLNDRHPVTPLELTLRVWAAFAGDQLGSSLADAIEAYIRRMAFDKDLQPLPRFREKVGRAALQMVLNATPVWTSGGMKTSLSPIEEATPPEDFSPDTEPSDDMDEIEPELSEELADSSQQPSIKKAKIASLLPALLENGLLQGSTARARFSHPEICAYLAGNAMSELLGLDAIFNRPEWLERPAWDIRSQAMGYFLVFSSHAPRAIERYINCDRGPLHRHLLSAARWLRDVPVNVPWRNIVMRKLVAILQVPDLPAGLRARALSAMVTSKTPGVQTMLRQMSASPDAVQRQLAPLGAGLFYDETVASDKTVTDALVAESCALLADPDPMVRRAACLGLAGIGTRPALEALADSLLSGDEDLRQFAAEALANHSEEGHPSLRDGATIDDVLVRRAVVHGLLRIREPWAVECLQKMQLEDKQWVVQNAAGQALEQLNEKKVQLPPPFPPLTETPWLITFGGEQGIGVSPGKPAYDLLLKALQEGRLEQQLAAMDYLRQHGDETAAGILTQMSQSSPGELREAAFNTLWHLSAAGVTPESP